MKTMAALAICPDFAVVVVVASSAMSKARPSFIAKSHIMVDTVQIIAIVSAIQPKIVNDLKITKGLRANAELCDLMILIF